MKNKFQSELPTRKKDASIAFFSEMGQTISEMGMIRGLQRATWWPIIPDHQELVLQVLRECITDGRMVGRTDGLTDGQSLT